MISIGLIVTGESERIGLAPALGRLFPQATFAVVPGRVDGFTSRRIPAVFTPPERTLGDSNEQKLVNTLLGAITDRNTSFDYALVIDDLETENWGQAAVVTSYFRQVVEHTLACETQRSRDLMREKCSFHLLHPMLEALFFGDANALDAAGAPPSYTVQRAPGDVELFTATDATYLNAPDEPKASRRRGNRRWAVADRIHKPKHYLMYLSEQPDGRRYEETDGGVRALQTLNWATLFTNRREVRFARSLIEDIAAMLNVASPYPGDCATETWRSTEQNVLRNL
ncbi:MAG: hypothetical protein U0165_16085 [Polyangiaceae bacterium]